jgi:hypothetical protein
MAASRVLMGLIPMLSHTCARPGHEEHLVRAGSGGVAHRTAARDGAVMNSAKELVGV